MHFKRAAVLGAILGSALLTTNATASTPAPVRTPPPVTGAAPPVTGIAPPVTGAAPALTTPSPAALPTRAPGPLRVAFLGDSYTYGVGASPRTDGYAYLVAAAEGWKATISGWPGSGYVRHATQDGDAIASGLPRVIASRAQVVIVECGHNDADPGVAFTNTEEAALTDLRALRAGLPDATIVVLGPIWLNGHPSRQVLAVRTAVHAAQRQIPGSLWIDPIGERWFTGTLTSKARTGDDATMINYAVGHPNDLGYQHIASLLEADLRRLGVR